MVVMVHELMYNYIQKSHVDKSLLVLYCLSKIALKLPFRGQVNIHFKSINSAGIIPSMRKVFDEIISNGANVHYCNCIFSNKSHFDTKQSCFWLSFETRFPSSLTTTTQKHYLQDTTILTYARRLILNIYLKNISVLYKHLNNAPQILSSVSSAKKIGCRTTSGVEIFKQNSAPDNVRRRNLFMCHNAPDTPDITFRLIVDFFRHRT